MFSCITETCYEEWVLLKIKDGGLQAETSPKLFQRTAGDNANPEKHTQEQQFYPPAYIVEISPTANTKENQAELKSKAQPSSDNQSCVSEKSEDSKHQIIKSLEKSLLFGLPKKLGLLGLIMTLFQPKAES